MGTPDLSFVRGLKEPFLLRYREHLAGLNRIVIGSGERLEGSLFYFHNTRRPAQRPALRRRHKRVNYAFCAITTPNILEIGFNAGHSALLALSANPALLYRGIDIGGHGYTLPCYDYLREIFGQRIDLTIGDSRKCLPMMASSIAGFDLIHIDGGHGEDVAADDLRNSVTLGRQGARILVDDTNQHQVRLLCDYYIAKGNLTELVPRMWRRKEQALFRLEHND